MEKQLPKPLPEVVLSNTQSSHSISRAVSRGRLRKLAPRLYTSNLTDDPADIVRRNLFEILGYLYPGAVISHRSALEGGPTKDGVIFLTYRYTKKRALPGVTVRLLVGPGSTDEDMPFVNGLFMSSTPRAYLENMQPSRARGTASKTLRRKEIESRLESVVSRQGEERLNKLRDQMRRTATRLEMEAEFRELDGMIGALLATQPPEDLVSSPGRARAIGKPYDSARMVLFQHLFTELKNQNFEDRMETEHSADAFRNIAFFEAYFSNYIEGTVFELEEAKEIVWEQKIPSSRPSDAHDILGTYRLVLNTQEMSRLPESENSLVSLLKSRHGTVMAERSGAAPGEFKGKANRAGQTHFVSPDLVRGTLAKGFEIYQSLEAPLAKAMFMMFVVAEVHPFVDGNGRIARVMMNAELVSAGRRRIIIPTVYREDYLLALRALSRQGIAEPYVRMLDRAHRFSAKLNFSSYDRALQMFSRSNAFHEPSEARFRDNALI